MIINADPHALRSPREGQKTYDGRFLYAKETKTSWHIDSTIKNARTTI